jgi:hypothetical protein
MGESPFKNVRVPLGSNLSLDTQHQIERQAQSTASIDQGDRTKNTNVIDGSKYFSGQRLIYGVSDFINSAKAPEFIVEKVIQRGQIYSFTAKWGHGKTALGLTWAVHIASGRDFAGFRTLRSRVLYLAGENPADVQLRVISICREFNIDIKELEGWLYFSDKAFPINQADVCDYFVKELKKAVDQPISLVMVDTGMAYSEMDSDNANETMHKVAVAMRSMAGDIYGASLVVYMHPTQGATAETLRSRGGGAFAGQIDGELLAWQDGGTKQIKFWHSTKFRGGGFDAVYFDLKRVELDGFDDNFGNKAVSVVALASTKANDTNEDELGGDTKLVFDIFVRCSQSKTLVTDGEWRRESYSAFGERKSKTKTSAFSRAKKSLLGSKMVINAQMHNSYRLPNATLVDVALEDGDD